MPCSTVSQRLKRRRVPTAPARLITGERRYGCTCCEYAPSVLPMPRSMPQQRVPPPATAGSDHATPNELPDLPRGAPCCHSSWLLAVSPTLPCSQPLSPTVSKSSVNRVSGSPIVKLISPVGAFAG